MGYQTPPRRSEQRRRYDPVAREQSADPWAKRYLRDPNRVLEEWDIAEAASILRGLNLNRYSGTTRYLIREARSAILAALRAIYDENWGTGR